MSPKAKKVTTTTVSAKKPAAAATTAAAAQKPKREPVSPGKQAPSSPGKTEEGVPGNEPAVLESGASCSTLALPSMFNKEKSLHARGNQHSKPEQLKVSQHALQKRLSGKLAYARNSAPEHVRAKWDEIEALKGKRGVSIQKHKKEFLLNWISNPKWDEAYFHQKLSLNEEDSRELKGVWITVGRLEQLIGPKECEVALAEGWWKTKDGPGSMKSVFYTEETHVHKESKNIEKQVRGGGQLAIEGGKDMMLQGLSNSWSVGMTGIEAPLEEEINEPDGSLALGVCRIAPETLPAKADVPPPVKKRPASAEEKAAEAEAAKKARAEEKATAKAAAEAKLQDDLHELEEPACFRLCLPRQGLQRRA